MYVHLYFVRRHAKCEYMTLSSILLFDTKLLVYPVCYSNAVEPARLRPEASIAHPQVLAECISEQRGDDQYDVCFVDGDKCERLVELRSAFLLHADNAR
jgi:hypothetical protein